MSRFGLAAYKDKCELTTMSCFGYKMVTWAARAVWGERSKSRHSVSGDRLLQLVVRLIASLHIVEPTQDCNETAGVTAVHRKRCHRGWTSTSRHALDAAGMYCMSIALTLPPQRTCQVWPVTMRRSSDHYAGKSSFSNTTPSSLISSTIRLKTSCCVVSPCYFTKDSQNPPSATDRP